MVLVPARPGEKKVNFIELVSEHLITEETDVSRLPVCLLILEIV